ncbi:MAG TPA: CHAT domain-containing protein, partial [Chitinophagaceae bacterium]|nr:CHAT domain-containing protein [Chitinophagaceae bacterium]
NLFYALTAKANVLEELYSKTQKIEYATYSLETYESAYKLIDYVAKTYNSDEARIFLSKIKYIVHGKPVKATLLLYTKTNDEKYLETAYYLDQKTKATTLVFNQNNEINDTDEFSDLQKEEKNVKEQITRLSLKGAQENNVAQKIKLESAIRDAEIELDKIQDKIKQKKSGTSIEFIPSSNKLQHDFLNDETAILSYHLADSSLTTFIIKKESLNYKHQKLPTKFYNDLESYIKNVHAVGFLNNNASLSEKLYDYLVPLSQLESIKHLILIPEDILNFLPFESLKNQGDFLINNFSVSYQYSTALLQKKVKTLSKNRTLGFAPFYSNAAYSFPKLPRSASEFENSTGTFLIDTIATKQQFITQYLKYNVLHIATHAVMSDTSPDLSYIAFSPIKAVQKDNYLLYAKEIYNLDLKESDLVILSACETGIGTLLKGEGMMSLSRAFAYAGCPSIVTSLWKADDESTAYIINLFHKYLNDGLSIDAALQKAKLDYLQDTKINPRKKHPFYWAHLVFIGYQKPATTSKLYYLLLLPLILIGVYFVLNYHKRSR